MIRRLAWLAVEAGPPTPTVDFYERLVGLPPDGTTAVDPARLVASYRLGDGRLELRSPDGNPPVGRHTHFAIEVAANRYDGLYGRFERHGPVTERTFGGNRSVYLLDPAGHVVEFGERPELDGAFGDIFEVVLEVEDRDRACDRYLRLGLEPVDQGTDRPRVRLTGAFDLELWEPHRGIAGARGGSNVELGLVVDDPEAAVAAIAGSSASPDAHDGGGLVVTDPDGHRLVFLET
ncbi:MAG: fosmidomycin resistance protein [Halobacteriales archaeon]